MVAHESHEVYEHYTETGIKYDLIGKVAEGTILTRKTVRAKKFFVAFGEKGTEYPVTYKKVSSHSDLINAVNSRDM